MWFFGVGMCMCVRFVVATKKLSNQSDQMQKVSTLE